MKIKNTIYLQLAFLIALILFLSIRRDGYFPYSEQMNGKSFAIILAMEGCFVIGIVFAFFRFKNFRFSISESYLKLAALLLNILLVTLISIIIIHDNETFSQFYSLDTQTFLNLCVSSILFISIPLLLKNAKWSIINLYIFSFLLFLVPIIYFPISSYIGDLAPIIQKQLEAVIHGQTMYRYFLLDNNVLTQAVRQPGTTISFIPAYLLHLDIRIMSVAFWMITSLVLLKIAYPNFKQIKFDKKFLIIYILQSLILLNPYRHSRSDFYDSFYFLILVLAIYFLKKLNLKIFAIIWGIAIATEVWSLIFSPFIAIYLYKQKKSKAIKYLVTSAILGALLLIAFIYPNFKGYYENVFGYYKNLSGFNIFAQTSSHFTPLLFSFNLEKFRQLFQIISYAIVVIISMKYLKSFKSLLFFLSLSFVVFLQFNAITWNYMYLLLVFIFVFQIQSELNS